MRFRSVTTSATDAANTIVSAPIAAEMSAAVGASSNSGCMRAIRYTPAVTIVAAWIRAETGVGPSIASGEPGVQRDLGRLRERADQDQQADRDDRPLVLLEHARRRLEHAGIVEVPGVALEQDRGQHEADVADHVDHERLHAGVRWPCGAGTRS